MLDAGYWITAVRLNWRLEKELALGVHSGVYDALFLIACSPSPMVQINLTDFLVLDR